MEEERKADRTENEPDFGEVNRTVVVSRPVRPSGCTTPLQKVATRLAGRKNEIEDLLCSRPGFATCSRGIIVDFDKIRRFTDSVLSMQNGDTVPVSRRRLREVKDAYAEYVFIK